MNSVPNLSVFYNHNNIYTYLNIVHVSVSETIIYGINIWALPLQNFKFRQEFVVQKLEVTE